MSNSINNKKQIKNNSNSKKISNGKINTKKVFPQNKNKMKIEEIVINEGSSRVKRNQQLYSNSNDKVSLDAKKNQGEKFSTTKQQKFNFDNKKVRIEDDKDDSADIIKKKKANSKVKNSKQAISVKVEDIPIKNSNSMKKKKNDSVVVTMLFLTVIIVFMGTFLIYHFGTFNHNKVKVVTKVKKIEVPPENIVFLGDSITEFYDLEKYFSDRNFVNSGIRGNQTNDILNDMKNRVYQYNPSHVFLLIGVNDLYNRVSNEEIINNTEEIVKKIKEHLPKTKIYLESIYPINNSDDEKINHSMVGKRSNEDIRTINKELKKFAKKQKIKYINLYDKLANEDGDLDLDYTEEGLHISDKGYEIITWEINKFLKDE